MVHLTVNKEMDPKLVDILTWRS